MVYIYSLHAVEYQVSAGRVVYTDDHDHDGRFCKKCQKMGGKGEGLIIFKQNVTGSAKANYSVREDSVS
jgi:hypothetical protein